MTRTKTSDGTPMYPRVYRADKTISIVGNSLGALLALSPIRIFIGHPQLSGALLISSLSWSMAFVFLYSVHQQVILYVDGIEKITWFSRRTLTRDEIQGWYGFAGYRGGYTYFLVPRDSRARKMRLMPVFRWDRAFFEWKKNIPQIER